MKKMTKKMMKDADTMMIDIKTKKTYDIDTIVNKMMIDIYRHL